MRVHGETEVRADRISARLNHGGLSDMWTDIGLVSGVGRVGKGGNGHHCDIEVAGIPAEVGLMDIHHISPILLANKIPKTTELLYDCRKVLTGSTGKYCRPNRILSPQISPDCSAFGPKSC